MKSLLKIGGGGFVVWLAGSVLLITALFSGVLFGIFDLTFKAGEAPTAVAGTGFIVSACGIILAATGCWGGWKIYKSSLLSIAGALGIVAGILSMIAGVFLLGAPEFALMFLVNLLYSFLAASFLLVLGVSLLLHQDKIGGPSQPSGIMCLIAGSAYIYGFSGVALILVPTTLLCCSTFFLAKSVEG
jgi:hypothetical protein